MHVFLDSLGVHAGYLDLSRLCVPAVKPIKLSLHLEKGGRVAHDEPLTSLSRLSLDDAPLHTVDTAPSLIDLHGPPGAGSNGPAVEVARPAGPAGRQSGGKLPPPR